LAGEHGAHLILLDIAPDRVELATIADQMVEALRQPEGLA
jgi:hypothetical protein